MLFFGLFALPRVFKPVMTLLLLLSAAVAYFINEYGVVIDVDMVRNVFLTNRAEAADLITFKLFFYVLVLGGLPTLLLWACTIVYRPFWEELWFRTKATAVFVAVVVVVAFPFAQNVTSVFREQRILQHVFTPLNYLSALDGLRPPTSAIERHGVCAIRRRRSQRSRMVRASGAIAHDPRHR